MQSPFSLSPQLMMTLALGAAACSSSSATSTGFEVVASADGSLNVVAGDAVPLSVVETFSDGTQSSLAPGDKVTWSGVPAVTVLASDSTADSPLPTPGAAPTALFVDNPARPDTADTVRGVLFVLDAGTAGSGSVTVTASISGTATATATATLHVAPTPTGSAARGATLYGAACASCHGATGDGSPANADGVTYTYGNAQHDYPAPGLNSQTDNLASDPDWNPALFAVAARADLDNGGLVLRAPMPTWLATPVSGHVLTTQDYADMYAFLKTK